MPTAGGLNTQVHLWKIGDMIARNQRRAADWVRIPACPFTCSSVPGNVPFSQSAPSSVAQSCTPASSLGSLARSGHLFGSRLFKPSACCSGVAGLLVCSCPTLQRHSSCFDPTKSLPTPCLLPFAGVLLWGLSTCGIIFLDCFGDTVLRWTESVNKIPSLAKFTCGFLRCTWIQKPVTFPEDTVRVCHVAFICEGSPKKKKITYFTKLFLSPP